MSILYTIPEQCRKLTVYRLASVPHALETVSKHGVSLSQVDGIVAALDGSIRKHIFRRNSILLDKPFEQRINTGLIRQTRFSDGSHRVFYSALDISTAECEVCSWIDREGGLLPKESRYYEEFSAIFQGRLKDLRDRAELQLLLTNPTDYSFCNRVRKEAIERDLDAILTFSARCEGTNVPVFSRNSLDKPVFLANAVVVRSEEPQTSLHRVIENEVRPSADCCEGWTAPDGGSTTDRVNMATDPHLGVSIGNLVGLAWRIGPSNGGCRSGRRHASLPCHALHSPRPGAPATGGSGLAPMPGIRAVRSISASMRPAREQPAAAPSSETIHLGGTDVTKSGAFVNEPQVSVPGYSVRLALSASSRGSRRRSAAAVDGCGRRIRSTLGAEDTGTAWPAPTGFALLRCDTPEATATLLPAGRGRSPAEVPKVAEETDPVAVARVRRPVRVRHGIATRGVVKNAVRIYDGHTANLVRLVGGGASLQEGVEPSSSPRCQSFPKADSIAQSAGSYPTGAGCLGLGLRWPRSGSRFLSQEVEGHRRPREMEASLLTEGA